MPRRLESIELQGIKTFATITRLAFPGHITAIVGPNGSGKSNIADSIRWVLGEQSYSSIRAKRTDDIIFSGSQQRPRAGMASVTITFNNFDGWLPIDFAEVSISRRAYRDGQNEYILNGQKVRLKDITELLAQTGLAERTYTIIGQGLVDVALALKPDERRKLFEEAAGIGLYRTRKEESLRRLENTQKNLDRVLDILTEIRPRLKSLERQSKRFEEYQQLRIDYEGILREWYGYHWHKKQGELNDARAKFTDQEKQLASLRIKHSNFVMKVEDARLDLQVNRKNLEEAHQSLSEYHRQLQESTRELAILEERQRAYQQQKKQLEIDLANLNEQISELESQDGNYQTEIDQQTNALDSANDAFDHIDRKLKEKIVKKDTIQSRLEEVRLARINDETSKVKLSAQLEELVNRLDSLSLERKKIEESILNLEKEKEQKKIAVGDLEKVYEQNQLDLKQNNASLSEQTEILDQLRKDKKRIDQKISTIETDKARYSAQLDVLTQAEAALSGYSQGSKTIVDFSRKGQLPAGIEPLSQHIMIDEKFERAFSAALGELTDLLIVPSQGESVVMEFLDSKDHERVALAILDPGKSQGKVQQRPEGEGFLGFANELVEVDRKFTQVINNLFSDILIMKDLRSAKKIQSKLDGNQKAVTLGGIVFQSNGVVISGNGQSSKRLGRTRQKEEIEQILNKTDQSLGSIIKDRKNIGDLIENKEAEYKTLSEQRQDAENVAELSRRELQTASDSVARINEQIKWHQDRLNDILRNSTQVFDLISKVKEDIQKIEIKIDEKHLNEKRISAEINDIPIFEIQQELNQYQTTRIVVQNKLQTAQDRYNDHLRQLQDVKKRNSTLKDRLGLLNGNLVEIKDTETLLKEKISSLDSTIEQIKIEKIDPLSAKSNTLEQAVAEIENSEDDHHRKVIDTERHFTQLQLELNRTEDQVKYLRERIESDFGLILFANGNNSEDDSSGKFADDEELIARLPELRELSDATEDRVKSLKSQIRRMGAINPEAQKEYLEVKNRFEFLTDQIGDLEKATKDLHEVISELDTLMERDFIWTFKAVNKEFGQYFTRLFNGGEASLVFSDGSNPVDGGVDIEVLLPGRRRQGLALLSGGERSLTAVALIFALLKVSPTPFCVLDEVDAMLDESNVGRFIELLQELSSDTQFVIITHNRNTVQAADVIYGITMGRDSTSQMISLKLEEVDETYLE